MVLEQGGRTLEYAAVQNQREVFGDWFWIGKGYLSLDCYGSTRYRADCDMLIWSYISFE